MKNATREEDVELAINNFFDGFDNYFGAYVYPEWLTGGVGIGLGVDGGFALHINVLDEASVKVAEGYVKTRNLEVPCVIKVVGKVMPAGI